MKRLDFSPFYDIDQTLNSGLVKAHLTLYNQALGLGMSDAQINLANQTYPKVFEVPQIVEFRVHGEDQFQNVRAQVRESREVNMAFDVMPGAVRGVNILNSATSNIGEYRTVRPHVNISLEEAWQAAVDWLSQKGFPSPENTTICDSPKDKIAVVLANVAAIGLPAILVDDTMDGEEGLMASSRAFSDQKLHDNLTFVGFGMDTIKARSIAAKHGVSESIQIHGLENWHPSSVHALIAQLAA